MARENFIGGTWRAAKSGRTDEVVNPATGEVLDEVAASGRRRRRRSGRGRRGRVRRAGRAHDAAPALRDPDEGRRRDRRRPGRRSKTSRSATSASPRSIIDFEMDLTVDNWRFFAAGARFLEGRAAGEYMEDHTSFLRRDPLGVVGVDRAVELPAEHGDVEARPRARGRQHRRAQAVGAHAAERAPARRDHRRTSCRPACSTWSPAQGETAGAALVSHPDVAMVSLTGDVATGQGRSRKAAADSLKRVHLELGGKAPVIVFDDADLEAVVATLTETGYYNSGQDCTAPCRVLAGAGRVRRLRGVAHRARSSQIMTGDPLDEDTAMGPVVSGEQLARVAGMVDRAREAGAEVTTGGDGARRRRLLLRAVGRREPRTGQRDRAARGVRPGRSRCSASPTRSRRSRGRTASTTASPRASGRATSAARCAWPGRSSSAPCGSTTTSRSSSELPHGGFKQSGYGKDMSIYAIEHYTEIKHVMVKH